MSEPIAPAITLHDDWGAFDELPHDENPIAPQTSGAIDNWSELWRLERNGVDRKGQPRFRWRLRFADSKPSDECTLPSDIAGQIAEQGRGKGNHAISRAERTRLKPIAEYLESQLCAGKKRRAASEKRGSKRQDRSRNSRRNHLPQMRRLVDHQLPNVREEYIN
jgi:hypothetical protein